MVIATTGHFLELTMLYERGCTPNALWRIKRMGRLYNLKMFQPGINSVHSAYRHPAARGIVMQSVAKTSRIRVTKHGITE